MKLILIKSNVAHTPTLTKLYKRSETIRQAYIDKTKDRFITLFKRFHAPVKQSGDNVA